MNIVIYFAMMKQEPAAGMCYTFLRSYEVEQKEVYDGREQVHRGLSGDWDTPDD